MRLLLLAVLLAASGLAAEFWFDRDPAAVVADSPRSAQAAPRAPGEPVSLPSEVGDLLARPLFSADRRPRSQDAPALAPATQAALPRMTAIVVDGAVRTAIFASPGGKPATLVEGGRIGAFTVQSIEPTQVTITGPGGRRVVRTSFDPAPPAAAATGGPLPQLPLGQAPPTLSFPIAPTGTFR